LLQRMSPPAARSVVLLLRTEMSGIGAGADMRRRLGLIGCAAYDPEADISQIEIPQRSSLLARRVAQGDRTTLSFRQSAL